MAAAIVSDTGPIHYLVMIEAIELLPALFGPILIPGHVEAELTHPAAPRSVKAWAANRPTWCAVDDIQDPPRDAVTLHAGEAAAIALALRTGASLVLMDDRSGVEAARRLGLRVTGTLGVLDMAARQGSIDLHAALTRLARTNFHRTRRLFDALLTQHALPPLP